MHASKRQTSARTPRPCVIQGVDVDLSSVVRVGILKGGDTRLELRDGTRLTFEGRLPYEVVSRALDL